MTDLYAGKITENNLTKTNAAIKTYKIRNINRKVVSSGGGIYIYKVKSKESLRPSDWSIKCNHHVRASVLIPTKLLHRTPPVCSAVSQPLLLLCVLN